MLIWEIVRVALSAIRANVMRAVLTTLGIIIGVAAVISVVALGQGAQANVQSMIQRIGTNVLTIHASWERSHGVATAYTSPLTLDDAKALAKATDPVLEIAPDISSHVQVTYSRWNTYAQVEGTWPSYFTIYDHHLEAGRYFTQSEVDGMRRVAVLGHDVSDDFDSIPGVMLIGKTIHIRGVPFTVVGVLEEKGSAAWLRPDDEVFIPVTTAQYRVFGGRKRLNDIDAATFDPKQVDAAYPEIDQIMRQQHKIMPGAPVDYQVTNAADLLSTFNETNKTLTWLLAAIAAVSLLVGGIGIMNIMLVSVTERTREIGVRKALGATNRSILFQFLVESLTLCVLGGVFGVALGYLTAAVMSSLAHWNTIVAPTAVFVALIFSAGVGLFFGILPAHRAASLDPIVALRYE